MAAATTKSHFHHQNDSSAPSGGGGVHKQTRRPRPITEIERAALDEFLEKVHYSPRLPPSPCRLLITDILMMILNTGLLLDSNGGINVVDMLCYLRMRLNIFLRITLIRRRGL